MNFPDIVLRLPDWVDGYFSEREFLAGESVEDRMRLVVELSELNVANCTGGPFAAGVFEIGSGRLVAVGVNVVIPSKCSSAHAEIMAISLAQKITGLFNLSLGSAGYELVTSTEPCAMCMGAVHWSGIRSVVCGAGDEDARKFGFDEGPKVPDWVQRFENAGIKVTRDVLRLEAAAVIKKYAIEGGTIYNG